MAIASNIQTDPSIYMRATIGDEEVVESFDDVADYIPSVRQDKLSSHEGSFYTYSLDDVKAFDQPQEIKPFVFGNMEWMNDILAKPIQPEQFTTQQLQQIHDQIHHYTDPSDITLPVFLTHQLIYEQFQKHNWTHPLIDRLDWNALQHSVSQDNNQTVDDLVGDQSESLQRCVDFELFTDTHKENSLLSFAGRWTPEMIRSWIDEDFRDDQRWRNVTRRANRLFNKMIRDGMGMGDAIQMAITKTKAFAEQLTKEEEEIG